MDDSESDNDFESADEGEPGEELDTKPVVEHKDHSQIISKAVVHREEEPVVAGHAKPKQNFNQLDDEVSSAEPVVHLPEINLEQKRIPEAVIDQLEDKTKVVSPPSKVERIVSPPIVEDLKEDLSITNKSSNEDEDSKRMASVNKSVAHRSWSHEDSSQKSRKVEKKLSDSSLLNQSSKESESSVSKEERRVLHLEKKLQDKKSQKEVLEKLSALGRDDKKTSPGWGLGWSSSLISSVSTFTSHVTQGIETVLETVEATLGAPTPEELAATAIRNEPELDKNTPASEELPGTLFGGVSAFTRALESTGSKVLTGGLDTLEAIGKKTMDILTEGDPGLRGKRGHFFGGSEVMLSQVLREARDKVDQGGTAESPVDTYPVHYSKLFDEFQGLVHLEALEILSEQCKSHLEDVVDPSLLENSDQFEGHEVNRVMGKVQTLCKDLPPTDDTPDDEMVQDFERLVKEKLESLGLPLNLDKMRSLQSSSNEWIRDCRVNQEKQSNYIDAKDIYSQAMRVLSEMAARAMEFFHKLAEILLVTSTDLSGVYAYAKQLTSLTSVLCTEISIISSQFGQLLGTAADDSEDPDSINPLITNVFLEASNSNGYIQEAWTLVIPILQNVAINQL